MWTAPGTRAPGSGTAQEMELTVVLDHDTPALLTPAAPRLRVAAYGEIVAQTRDRH